MVGGCRLHSHSRTTGQHALSSGERNHEQGTVGLQSGNYTVKRVDRKFNASDLRKFLPMIGCHTMTVKKGNFNAVMTMLKEMPAARVTAFLASMAETLKL